MAARKLEQLKRELEQCISPIAEGQRRTLPVNYKQANARGFGVFYASTAKHKHDYHSEPLNETASSKVEYVIVPETQESAEECVSVSETQQSDYECASDVVSDSDDRILIEESHDPSAHADSPFDMANTTLLDETEVDTPSSPSPSASGASNYSSLLVESTLES